MKTEEHEPNGSLNSMKPSQWVPTKKKSTGLTGHSLNACLMSNLAIRADLPSDFTIDTTSSNLENFTQ